MSVVFKIGLLLLLILINAFFAMSEIAIISFNDNKMKKLAEDGNKKAIKLVRLTSQPSKFLSTIQVGVTLAGFLTSASASTNFAQMLNDAIVRQFEIQSTAVQSVIFAVSVVVITLITSYFSLVLGELVPKQIGMQKCEAVSLAVAGPLLAIKTVLAPIIFVLTVSTNALVRLFGLNPDASNDKVTEEEIRMMVDVGNEEGSIEKDEADMIDNIFEFDDITVEDVMTHRTDVAAVENTATVMDVIRLAIDEGFSRIPVYREDIDDIIGIVYAKDMLRCINETPDEMSQQSITSFIRPAIFVPESNRCSDLFKTFKEKKTQMAIVVDEYGGTSGVVTMEDLLESIVGNMEDEYDQEEEEYQKVSDNIFILDGSMSIEDVEELLGCNIGPEEDYDTLSGLITDKLDRIPAKDEHPVVRINNVEFTVLDTEERRIAKLRADILPEEPKPEEPDEE